LIFKRDQPRNARKIAVPFIARIDAIQVVYSLMNREAARLIADLAGQGVVIVARECLANGFLSGTITADTVFPEGTLNARYPREEVAQRAAYDPRFGPAIEGSFGADMNWDPAWELRWIDVSLAAGGSARLFHTTSRANKTITYIGFWDPEPRRWIGWDRIS
jgi:hypothetical protein